MLGLHNPSMLKQIAWKGKKNTVFDNVNYSFRWPCVILLKEEGCKEKMIKLL